MVGPSNNKTTEQVKIDFGKFVPVLVKFTTTKASYRKWQK